MIILKDAKKPLGDKEFDYNFHNNEKLLHCSSKTK